MTATTTGDELHLVGWLLLTDATGRLLLARRDGVSHGAGLWGLPGGHLDPGESFLAAAVRETREEVGVVADPRDVRPYGVQHYSDDGTRGVSVFFTTAVWQGDPRPVAECSEVGWFPPDALPDDTLGWLPPILRRFATGTWFGESGLV
jgi:8-oxo-dGTP diphosphatase